MSSQHLFLQRPLLLAGDVETNPGPASRCGVSRKSTTAKAVIFCACQKSISDTNPRRQAATAEVGQRTKKTSLKKKASEVFKSIFGSTQPERTPGLLLPWLQTGSHVLEVDGAKSCEAEKDKIWALQRLAKDWNSCDLTIYADGSATNVPAIGGGGILVTAGFPCNPTIHHSYALPAGTWCSSIQAEMKAVKKTFQIIQTEESPKKVCIVRDSQSIQLRLQASNLQCPLRALTRMTT